MPTSGHGNQMSGVPDRAATCTCGYAFPGDEIPSPDLDARPAGYITASMRQVLEIYQHLTAITDLFHIGISSPRPGDPEITGHPKSGGLLIGMPPSQKDTTDQPSHASDPA